MKHTSRKTKKGSAKQIFNTMLYSAAFFASFSPFANALPDPSVRDQVIYFVMPDRFSDGSASNNLGTEYDVTSKYMYHGGDIVGLTSKLDYLQGLGVSTIWTTPIMGNKSIQIEPGIGPIAGYHGYWVEDFLGVDKHLGTSNELKTYVDSVHARGMKTYFDILVNHTADVIRYKECLLPDPTPLLIQGSCDYISKTTAPYKDEFGNIFDDADFAYSYTTGTPFPPLSLNSFPRTPITTDAEAHIKNPNWLNDPIYYHNRGDLGSGESMIYGDLYRLDDLFTLHPRVIKGMVDIYEKWIDKYGIDGYRLDATRHTENAFLQQWYSAIAQHAIDKGHKDFFVFGEVFDPNPLATSPFLKDATLPAVLDFPFQDSARKVFSAGAPTKILSDLFESDDYYVGENSNAYFLPTFLGNHDMGRFGAFLKIDNPSTTSDAELLARDSLAHAFMFTSRGIPVIYYGDEQGFTGSVNGSTNFETARQDMFPSKTSEYTNSMFNSQIGTTATPANDNFDTTHPLYKKIKEFAKLRATTLELRQGSQLARYSDNSAKGGIFAFSRIMMDRKSEVLVVFNTNATETKSATFKTLPKNSEFKSVYPSVGSSLFADANGNVTATLPPLSFRVFRAKKNLAHRTTAPQININNPTADFGYNNFWVGAGLDEDTFAKVSFYAQLPNSNTWVFMGTDDNAPYRINFDGTKFNLGDVIHVKAVVTDYSGNTRESASKNITIENRLKTVKLVYENGNHRDEFYTIRPSAQITIPQPLTSAGYSFDWPIGEQKITFFFDNKVPTVIDGKNVTLFDFDTPLDVNLTQDVIPNADLTTGGLTATLYVNNAHKFSKTNNFVGSPAPEKLPFNVNEPNPAGGQTDLFIRGSMNGWSATDNLTYIMNYTFSGKTTFSTADNQFKIADVGWGAFNLGAPFASNGLNNSGSSGNISFTVPDGLLGLFDVNFFVYPALDGGSGKYYFYRLAPEPKPLP